jgi:post-segregation antitoxin (ccd killing protein)
MKAKHSTSHKKREVTSIKVDPELWKKAKIEAINREIDLSELVEDALRKEIKGGGSVTKGVAPMARVIGFNESSGKYSTLS